MQIETIPLSQLKPYPRNVRKTGGASIDDLVASIAEHGLRHNLTVTETAEGYEVCAGGRRLRALQKLAEAGALPVALEEGIPCMVVSAEKAAEISLAENVIRQAIHPVDEFNAFKLLIEEGASVDQVAARFGVKPRHVEERLRLANVAPELLEVYRRGDATLEQIMALSVVDDHAAQLAAWGDDDNTAFWQRRPDSLRDQLLESVIISEEPIALFVGTDAYIEAGGTIRPDLFSDIKVLEDGALVKRLAMARLKVRADELAAEGWGWVEAKLDWSDSDRFSYKQLDAGKPNPLLGAVVTIGSSGKLDIYKGLLRPGDKEPKGAKTKAPGAGKSKTTAKNPMGEANEKLEGVRLGVVRAHLRANPDKTRAVLVARMATDYFNMRDVLDMAFGEMPVMPYKSPGLREVIGAVDSAGSKEDSVWRKRIEAAVEKHGSVLVWLLTEPHTCDDLMQFLAVETVDISCYDDADRQRLQVALDAIGVNLADHWQLTPEWLQAQGKDYILAALKDAMGEKKFTDGGWSKLKAALLPEQAHKALVAAGWLPEPMRQPEVKKPAAKSRGKAA